MYLTVDQDFLLLAALQVIFVIHVLLAGITNRMQQSPYLEDFSHSICQ